MITIIVAYCKNNRVIGKAGKIPWHLPDDIRHFKDMTQGQIVIMGRKTWQSIPKLFRPLAGRYNIVLSHNSLLSDYAHERKILAFDNIDKAIEFCETNLPHKEVFIIGGAQIYKEFLDRQLVDRVVATEIEGEYNGDVFFPELSPLEWQEGVIKKTKDDFTIVEYIKC